MIFCPDRIIPDSSLTELNNIYIYIYIYICVYIYIYILSKAESAGGGYDYILGFSFSQYPCNLKSSRGVNIK